jgi:hypothetical protein
MLVHKCDCCSKRFKQEKVPKKVKDTKLKNEGMIGQHSGPGGVK